MLCRVGEHKGFSPPGKLRSGLGGRAGRAGPGRAGARRGAALPPAGCGGSVRAAGTAPTPQAWNGAGLGAALGKGTAPRPGSELRAPALCVTLPASAQPAGPHSCRGQRRWGKRGPGREGTWPAPGCRGSGEEKAECCSAMVGGAALSAPALCSLSSPPPAQSSDCFRHARLWLLSPSPCKKQETEETPLPSASCEKWGGDLSHAVRGCQW